MRPRLIAALAALTLVVTATYVASSLTADDVPVSSGVIEGAAADPRLAELDRLVDVFERRTMDRNDPLDFRTLGRFYLDRARLAGNVDDYLRANTALERAVELAPNDTAAAGMLARGSVAVHRFERARALTAEILDENPLDATALLAAADAHAELGDTGRAAALLDRASLIAPNNPSIIVRRAVLAHGRGAQHEAVALAASARRQAGDDGIEGRGLSFYYLVEADLRGDLGEYEAALALTREALVIAPAWAEALAANAGALASLGEYPEAIVAYTAALEHRPGDPAWLAARADLWAATGRPGEAERDLAHAIRVLRSGDPVIYGRALSRLLADHALEPAESLRLAEADLARRQDVAGFDTYAWALYRNGRFAAALEAIRPVLDAGLFDAEARLHAGLILAAAGKQEAGAVQLRWVLDTNPGFDPLLAGLAADALATLGS